MRSNLSFISAILTLFFILSSCNATKFTAENLPETQLIFGNGGGFSGLVNQFLLLENGQLFEKKGGSKSFVALSKVRKKHATTIFNQLDSMAFLTMEIDQPGNIYHFIQLKAPGVDHKLTWGKSDHQADSQVESLYKNLRDLVKKDK